MQEIFAGYALPRYLGSLRSGTLAKRLADYKQRKAQGLSFDMLTSYRTHTHGDGQPTGTTCYLDSDLAPVMRWKYCDDIAKRIGHKGWYIDEQGCFDTVRGIVLRLNHDRGFIAGWTMGEGMITELDYHVHEDEERAAYAADRLAMRSAEAQREWEAKEQARELAERDANCPTCKSSITMADICHPSDDYCDECRELLCA